MSNGEVKILGTGSSVPERIITNFDLEKMVDTSDEWITTRTGIKEKKNSTGGRKYSTFALLAAQRRFRLLKFLLKS